MPNRYVSSDESRAPRVRALFSRIAGRYDLVNDVMSLGMHRRWKRDTVRLALAQKRAPRVLDLCCGSGDLAFEAGDRGASRVAGADFTLPMLAVARKRAADERSKDGAGVSFVQADALALPFRDGAFDAVTVGYGLRNVADLRAALAEIRRVLAPGGTLAALDFGKPDAAVPRLLYRAFLAIVMPAMGWIFHGDPQTYSYIPASLETYPGQRGVEKLMHEAGFVDARHEDRLLGTMGINLGEAPR